MGSTYFRDREKQFDLAMSHDDACIIARHVVSPTT
jgi:hypothetical protein